jgi:diguanylate cyclase (GGDEF)-like protein/putative nucleotidyltransferase with HDIG domain
VILFGKKISLWAATYVVAGTIVCAVNLARADSPDLHRFILYLVCANVATLGLTLSGASGLVPAGLLVMLLGVEDLSLPEILFIAFTVTLLNEGRKVRRVSELAPVLYAVATITIGFATAQYVYKLTSSLSFNAVFPAPLIASSFVLLFNCGLAATLLEEPRLGQKNGPFLGVYRRACRPLLPWFVAAAYLAYLIRATSLHTGTHPGIIALPILFALDRGYRAWFHEKTTHRRELEEMYRQTLETLGLAIDSRDQMNHTQPRRVRIYAAAVARELKLSETEIQNLDTAALLHDIGKLGIPDYILMKPSALTAEEWEKMKTHPTLGAEMLSRMNYPEEVLSIVKAYREKWDGTGYPRGLSGNEIPIGARILAAVDCFDALASDRPYRGALPLRKAMTTLRSERGKSLDPDLVYILEQRYEELEQLAWKASGKTPPAAGLQLSVSQPPEEAGTPQVKMLAGLHSAKGSIADPIASARQETQLLQALSNELANALRVEDVLEGVHKRLSQLVAYDTMAIYCGRGENIELVAVAGACSHLFSKVPVPLAASLSGSVLQRRTPVINGDIRLEPSYSNDSLVFQRLQSTLAVPFEGENQVQGVLALFHPDRNAFKREELRVVQQASLHAGRALENALKYQNATESAVTDHLTGVPNARSLAVHLQRELARAGREESTLGVLVCDLDGFKQVNDRFGHLVGNEVLQRVAKGLAEVCRGSDYLARMGGDEFVIVLPGVTDEIAASQTERLRSVALETGWKVCGEECLSMSVGMAVYPVDGADSQALLAEADRRMYADKQHRKAEMRKRREMEAAPGVAMIQGGST